MAMERAEFDALVARLEAFARERPDAYRLRVTAIALLGYAYLALMLTMLLAALAASVVSVFYLKAVGIKLLLIVAPFVWLVVESLWVELGEPVGAAITPSSAPALFERVERLREALDAPKFHRVLVTDEFNAAVVQVPRLGMFGWHRNFLLLGLPLLKSLSPEQLDAVLAHEFGHLAGGHARFANWLYRLRAAWSRLLDALQRKSSVGSFLFRPFFTWYVPRFSAYSFPLARANEYEADAVAAELTSGQALAQALTGVNVVGRFLGERYWPSVHAQATNLPQPAFGPYSQLGTGLHDRLDADDSQRWLKRALTEQTTSEDTHPALSDRLRAIGVAAELAPPAAGQGADQLLGSAAQAITERLDRAWHSRIAHDWNQHYEKAQQARQQLAALNGRAAGTALSDDDALERARLEGEYGEGSAAAVSQLRSLLEHAPDNAFAHYLLGKNLLGMDDESGVAHIERAMALNALLTGHGHDALRDFHWRRSDDDAAKRHHQLLAPHQGEMRAAAAERARLDVRDTLLPHGLDEETIAAIRATLEPMQVREAWLVRKQCQHQSDVPLFVFGFTVTPPFQPYRETRCRDVIDRISSEITFPGETLIINTEGDHTAFADRLRMVTDSRVV